MLSLFTRRVALSAHRSTATYTRIVLSHSTPHARLYAGTVQTNPQRNASTKATATTNTGPSTKSNTTGRTKPTAKLTPEEKAAQAQLLRVRKESDRKKKVAAAAALRAKQKARAEREKEAAAQKRKCLAEKKKKLADAEKEKVREKKRKEKEKVRKEKERKQAIAAKKPTLIKPPSRHMSALALYLHETKQTVPVGMVGWKILTEEERQKYEASAKVVRDKRKEEFNAFVKTITPLDLRRYNRERKTKGRQRIRVTFPGPRHPVGPFIKYMEEFRNRPDQAGKRAGEIAKAAGVVWNSLTQEEKDQYRPKPTESTAAKEDSQSL